MDRAFSPFACRDSILRRRDPPEERLFPVIDNLLDAWQAEYLPEAKGLRLIGDQWSPRSHAIKNFLVGNLIPHRWLDVGSDELPTLVFEDGSVLRNPDPRQVAERLGRSLSAASDVYDLVIVSAGPAGLAAAVSARRKGCGPCCSTGTRRVGRRARAPGSRTTSGFLRVSAAPS